MLFHDALIELKKIRHPGYLRPPRALLWGFAKEYISMSYLLTGMLAYGMVYGAMISYTNLKPAVPLLDPTIYDVQLSQWDGYLFQILSLGGVVSLPKNPTVAKFFDKFYFHLWTFAGITLVVLFRDRATFWRFTAAWCLAFGLSIPISVFFPSIGPALLKPGQFTYIVNTNSAELMRSLWEQYLSFKMDPYHSSVVSGNGLVAMPSLHVALVFISVIKLGKYFPGFRVVLWVFLFLSVFATVYLGWHYLTDGIAGIMLGWIAYKVSSLWFSERGDHGCLKVLEESVIRANAEIETSPTAI